MSGQDAIQPLLEDQEISTAWDQEAGQEAAEDTSIGCNVQTMFQEHPHDVLRFLQTSGVEKLAEFSAEVQNAEIFGTRIESKLAIFVFKFNSKLDFLTLCRTMLSFVHLDMILL